jgi:hypothetical protein
MELSTLTAKQKRIRSWSTFVNESVGPGPLKIKMEGSLTRFGELLNEAWETGNVSSELESRIVDMERQLEELLEEARLHVHRSGGRSNSPTASHHSK